MELETGALSAKREQEIKSFLTERGLFAECSAKSLPAVAEGLEYPREPGGLLSVLSRHGSQSNLPAARRA